MEGQGMVARNLRQRFFGNPRINQKIRQSTQGLPRITRSRQETDPKASRLGIDQNLIGLGMGKDPTQKTVRISGAEVLGLNDFNLTAFLAKADSG
jgi:hypothetical protein